MEDLLNQVPDHSNLVFSVPDLAFREGGTIPQIGFGTYELTGNDCREGVIEALRIGYRHIDTASVYRNEKDIADAILHPTQALKREQLFITSKIAPGEQGFEQSKIAVRQIINRLKITYLDCVLIHWPGVSKQAPTDPKCADIRLESWKGLIELKNEGLVKHIGVSNFTKKHLQHLQAHSKVLPEINQFELHPLCQPKETIQFCKDNQIIIEAYSSLGRQHEKVVKNPKIIEIAKHCGKSVSQVLLRWALQNEFVVIPKSKRSTYIAENFNILNFTISKEDMDVLNSMNEDFHTCWNPNVVTN